MGKMAIEKKEKRIRSSNVKILILSIILSVSYLSFFYIKANQPSSISLKYRRANTRRSVEKGETFKINSTLWSQLFKSNYVYFQPDSGNGDMFYGVIDITKLNRDRAESIDKWNAAIEVRESPA